MLNTFKRLAARSTHPAYKHVAAIQRGGSLIATSYNRNWEHAEARVIKKLWASACVGAVAWSLRFTKSGRLASAKPCPDCWKLLVQSGIKTVIYSDSSGQLIKERL
jgi:deoxycytidylate deaminase